MPDANNHANAGLFPKLKFWARSLKIKTLVVFYAAKDPRTPLFPKILAFAIAAYALSPIDLIPDFIPIVGYLDDLLIVPAGLWLVLRMIPENIIRDATAKSVVAGEGMQRFRRIGLVFVLSIWVIALGVIVRYAFFKP